MLKFVKRLLILVGLVVALFCGVLILSGNTYIIRGVWVTYLHGEKTAYLTDYRHFDNRSIAKSPNPQNWKEAVDYNSAESTKRLDSVHGAIGTVAFMIIKNDSIWYEKYYDGFGQNSHSNSFSMAKSVVTSALGRAIMDGKIESLNTKVGTYFPEFSQGLAGKLTVGDLASMASGLDWDEKYYSPFSKTTQAYFDNNLEEFVKSLKVIHEPGTVYQYSSGSTQLLSMCIEKAVGKDLATYVSESFWQPMGAENEALWQTDHKGGIVKAYCCIASNARDFARFGKLYKQKGKWNGKQLLDSSFVKTCTTPRFPESPQYGYGWWLDTYNGKQVFYMRGHLGQYVIVVPKDDLIVVRLGHKGNVNDEGSFHSNDFYVYLDETYKMLSLRK
ncbi:serine hydrolase domain-containing protein [Flavobacterium selenitireducens]|uniref:serine hydrolase domain-containing protein n=1 Tax=Flavobacterium selenitireducens TaxID=2722704 RepID=UPI00168BE6D2|nr:serine hydrolase [Flavobacterium selenitireducens]MBD3581662.1 serine hydrolase [Flavobacterium selenitireducens]